jgi:hypothetical protein
MDSTKKLHESMNDPSSSLKHSKETHELLQTPPVPAPAKQTHTVLILIVVIVLLAFSSGIAYFLGTKRINSVTTPNTEQQQREQTGASTPTPTTTHSPLFSGQLKKLGQNLQLFLFTEEDTLNGMDNDFAYYEAGTFNTGELKDYTRILAIRPPGGPGQPIVFTLATKDYTSYILDDPENKTTQYPADDWQNPYRFLDKSKITSAKTFQTEQPQEITLDSNFALYKEALPTETLKTNRKDKNGNWIYETGLVTQFSSYQTLPTSLGNLTVYFKPYKQNNEYYNQLNPAEKEKFQQRQKYLLGDTEVVVTDSVGLPVTYSMTTAGNSAQYSQKLVQHEAAMKTYEAELEKFQKKEISQYPKSPDYVYLPNFGFTKTEIKSQGNFPFFTTYETAIPGACSTSQNSRVMNVSNSDLEQIGSVSSLTLYRLKDTHHPLYTLAYNTKMEYYNQDLTAWDQVNKGIKKPSLEEYVSQNPLLFIKNYWQQWVALGEFDIKLPGGCGKPVIYLYPTTPTDVSLQFTVPVEFTTAIPTYTGSWQVRAYPDGTLKNRVPELTDCQKIDTQQKGSEYARDACKTNTYPYIYWAGNVHSRNYPVITDGWIVSQETVHGFLTQKLTQVGLNDTEKTDFLSYWAPEILKTDAPYYKISFLQTNDLNTLFPMTIHPAPNTIFRLFLDYTPLTEKPQIIPKPQALQTLVRNGFTFVEWGGLKYR